MPYIKPETRKWFDDTLAQLRRSIEAHGENKGAITYCVYKLVHSIYVYDGARYETLSNGASIFNDCAAEWYRDVLGPYEESKRIENGGM